MNKESKLPELKRCVPSVQKLKIERFRFTLLILAEIVSLTTASFASSEHNKGKNSQGEILCDVNNFGKVTDFYYRGAQPEKEEYSQLAKLGIKTIVDLRTDPKDFAKETAERAGLKYINMPMSDSSYPTADLAPKFLSIVNDQENWPVYVHCAGGRHRTGAMTAVFRMRMKGWDADGEDDMMKD